MTSLARFGTQSAQELWQPAHSHQGENLFSSNPSHSPHVMFLWLRICCCVDACSITRIMIVVCPLRNSGSQLFGPLSSLVLAKASLCHNSPTSIHLHSQSGLKCPKFPVGHSSRTCAGIFHGGGCATYLVACHGVRHRAQIVRAVQGPSKGPSNSHDPQACSPDSFPWVPSCKGAISSYEKLL